MTLDRIQLNPAESRLALAGILASEELRDLCLDRLSEIESQVKLVAERDDPLEHINESLFTEELLEIWPDLDHRLQVTEECMGFLLPQSPFFSIFDWVVTSLPWPAIVSTDDLIQVFSQTVAPLDPDARLASWTAFVVAVLARTKIRPPGDRSSAGIEIRLADEIPVRMPEEFAKFESGLVIVCDGQRHMPDGWHATLRLGGQMTTAARFSWERRLAEQFALLYSTLVSQNLFRFHYERMTELRSDAPTASHGIADKVGERRAFEAEARNDAYRLATRVLEDLYETRGEAQTRMLNAIDLMVDARYQPRDHVCLSLLFSSLEALLLDRTRSIKESLANRSASLLLGPADPREPFVDRIKRLYEIRCNLLHEGTDAGGTEEIASCIRLTLSLLRSWLLVCMDPANETANPTELIKQASRERSVIASTPSWLSDQAVVGINPSQYKGPLFASTMFPDRGASIHWFRIADRY